jgi:hypothetical protein
MLICELFKFNDVKTSEIVDGFGHLSPLFLLTTKMKQKTEVS